MFTEGVLYNHLLSQADYDTVKNYADKLWVVVWCKNDKRGHWWSPKMVMMRWKGIICDILGLITNMLYNAGTKC